MDYSSLQMVRRQQMQLQSLPGTKERTMKH